MEKEVIVGYDLGMIPEILSYFVEEASKFDAEITIQKNNNKYNGKSIVSVLSIGAIKGDKLKMIAEGPDEEEAINKLMEIFINKPR